ncbi:S-adenosyl-L-methionine-dependent methyltransferase [Podospora appendiculata]|uniref:S-adenosyl-L-methionine-dependent methyltransferase n=1 Tax=Podospora appendiculata TaxID=314037 RepID=A0AAE0WYK1_9PEZI|nr:S-adenosyl-L-methionine-dependent methyltransferase [Podospora appendiculata]KAK3681355.1 S-adenosyl-L-methionine-dependent methyltransferase [Podospora appendiculata]
METNGTIFAQDDKFWANYVKGRPQPPASLFDRIFNYHASHGGSFTTAHDVGAGNGVYAQRLRSRFPHVIVSDIVPENITLAQRLLPADNGFTFRAAALADVSDIPPATVDMVFAMNMMHFPDPQDTAMRAVAHQLRPGGTFAAALFGPARFRSQALQDLWSRISHQGGRELLARADDQAQTIRIMARTQGAYNVAPLDPDLFLPGALRVHLNTADGGIQGMLPPEEAHRDVEGSFTGQGDVEVWEEEMDGWSFETDLEGVKEHFGSFPFVSKFPEALRGLFEELEGLRGQGPFGGYFPVTIILATRR